MTSIKKWQCPYCPQDSARHWNIVVHIGRMHKGVGDPVEKGDTNQAEKSFSLDPNRQNMSRKYPFIRNDSNHHSTKYWVTDRDNESVGDIIDYVYHFLTEIEEKRYKMSEINRITNKHNSSAAPGWVPSINYIHPPTINTIGAWLLHIMRNIHSSPFLQTYSHPINISSSKEANEKTPKVSFPGNDKHKEKKQQSDLIGQSIHSENDLSEEDTSLYARWVIKRDMYGNIIDNYKYYKEPIHELLDDAKENAKYFTFAPGQN
jgi:hypothetical protein